MNQSHEFAWRLDGAEAFRVGFKNPASIAVDNFKEIRRVEKELKKELVSSVYDKDHKRFCRRFVRDNFYDDLKQYYKNYVWPWKAWRRDLIDVRKRNLFCEDEIYTRTPCHPFNLNDSIASDIRRYIESDLNASLPADKISFYYPKDWFKFVEYYKWWTVKTHFIAEDFIQDGKQYFHILGEEDRKFFEEDNGVT